MELSFSIPNRQESVPCLSLLDSFGSSDVKRLFYQFFGYSWALLPFCLSERTFSSLLR